MTLTGYNRYSSVIFVDLGVTVDGTYYYDLLVATVTTLAACHTTCH